MLRTHTHQNISNDFFDDGEYIAVINVCMNLLFQYMNKKNTWHYSVKIEDVVDMENGSATGDAVDRFKLSYNCMGIISNPDNEQPPHFTGVKGDGEDLARSHFILPSDITDNNVPKHYTLEADELGTRFIRTSHKFKKLNVMYKRGPKKVLAANMNNELDIPEELIGALLKFCIWMTVPVNLEQGASLANYHKNEASEFIGTYEDILGHDLQSGFYSGHGF